MDVTTCRNIPSVPLAKELIDSSLSKTQRKTPTEIHRQYDIVKIRSFYTRKVKFIQQTFHDKLQKILDTFPNISNIHPFYSDLFNILYDKDHYKIALGKVNISKTLIDNIARDYCRLLKYGDSLFRCKCLKRIMFGKSVKVVKKLAKSLEYLEEVRKHISRLPTIEPNGKIVIIAGFPNTGKSSFLNNVSRANVEVEPYPFTTKSLYIGQSTYNQSKFQFIDTPGILDSGLEDRNTIEMQSITALAHLKSTIIFFIDISETCGYSIIEQINLFHNIQPLFTNKPVLIACNKIDLVKFHDLSQEVKEMLTNFTDAPKFFLSTLLGDGVEELRERACQLVLTAHFNKNQEKHKILIDSSIGKDFVIETFSAPKLITDLDSAQNSTSGTFFAGNTTLAPKLITDSDFAQKSTPETISAENTTLAVNHPAEINNGISNLAAINNKVNFDPNDLNIDSVYIARPKYINPERKPYIPPKLVEDIQQGKIEKCTPTQKELATTLGDDYHFDEKSRYFIPGDQKYDIIPEIYNGKNISDFIDRNIVAKIAELEKEEKLRDQAGFYNIPKWTEFDKKAHYDREIVTDLRMLKMKEHTFNKSSRVQLPKVISSKVDKFKERVGKGLENKDEDDEIIEIPEIENYPETYQNKLKASGMDKLSRLKRSKKMIQKSRIKPNLQAKAGPGDRHIYTNKPQHLFSGKRKAGKTQRR